MLEETVTSTSGDAGRKRRIAIVGMGRSGTSFLAKFCAKSGIYMGKIKGGKFEHSVGRQINDAILTERFGAREGRPYGSLPPEEIRVDGSWRLTVEEFIRDMDAQAAAIPTARYWGYKDPRTTVLHSLWLDHFDVVVGIFRRPQDVIDSYLAQHWISGWFKRRTALKYWMRFNSSLLHIADTVGPRKPVYIIDYNADVPHQLRRLCEVLDVPVLDEAMAIFKPSRGYTTNGVKPEGGAEVTRMYERLRAARNLT
jgi:hypothetical protein